MKIAIINSFGQVIGGCETYLRDLIPALEQAGEEVGFWHEYQGLPTEPKVVTTNIPQWCVERTGAEECVQSLRAWKPDLLYVHGLSDPAVEQRLLEIAPAAVFLHGYSGACISGTKLWKRPLHPCDRKFGAGCLLAYYPKRCGGLNPFVMWREFQRQKNRLKLLHQYRALLTHSDHMVSTFTKQGIPAERLFKVPFPVKAPILGKRASLRKSPGDPWRLLFLGRLEYTKGGMLLLNALPYCVKELEEPLDLIIAGSGTERSRWEARAQDLTRQFPQLHISFVGWVPEIEQRDLLERSDLLVFPSVWPEPFGMAGAEAALAGLPVAAFDVGGVGGWIKASPAPCLASAHPPTAIGFAGAIIQAIHAARRQTGTTDPPVEKSGFGMKAHLSHLRAIFETVLNNCSAQPR